VSDQLSDHEQRIVADVEQHGWYCSAVYDPDQNDPDFAYSVGFTETLAAPEFIVFGLPLKLMHSMLWTVFRQIKGGVTISDGSRWSGLVEGFDCVARPVHPTNLKREYLNSAMWFWGNPAEKGLLPVFQLVWPGSADGLFPWDEDCADSVRALQPPLYLPARDLH
jgi:hypothetical protein